MTTEPEPAGTARRHALRLALQMAAVSVVLLLLALLVWKLVDQRGGTELVSDVQAGVNPQAPAFDLPVIWDRDALWPPALRPALADERVALSELRGHPVVLNFWASWCGPCKEEAPELAAAAEEHAGRVAFLGVDVQDFESGALRFLRELDVPYVSVRDEGSSTYAAYGLTGLPETYYLDAEGRIVDHSIGAVSPEELEAGIRAATAGRQP